MVALSRLVAPVFVGLLMTACSSSDNGTSRGGDAGTTSDAAAGDGGLNGIVCAGDWHSTCACKAADHTDTSQPCFETSTDYPCCAKTGTSPGSPDYACSCDPSLPATAQPIVCRDGVGGSGQDCECGVDGSSGVVVAMCPAAGAGRGTSRPCFATQTATSWDCHCYEYSDGASGTPVADCTVPADAVAKKPTCPDGFSPTNNCDGNCHDEQCHGCSGKTCSSAGCEGNQSLCAQNKCISIPAGGTCGFSH